MVGRWPNRSIALVALLVATSCVAPEQVGTARATPASVSRSPSPTSSPIPTPQLLTLPYSWEKGGIRATLIAVRPLGLASPPIGSPSSSPGYKRIGVVGGYHNLQNVAATYRYMLDDGATLPALELETSRGNRYKTVVGSGLLPPVNGLRPEESSAERTAVFETRVDEDPVTLFGLVHEGRAGVGTWRVAYIWKLR